jgi:sugar/nucleoside kinase (ribokinase family)
MPDAICAGIVVVDHVAAPIARLPAAGELALTDDCRLAIGGCAANVAVDLCKQGVSASLCGLVGDDAFGDFARRTLATAGVDVRDLATADAARTSQTLILNVQGQDRRFVHHIGANRSFRGERLGSLNFEGVKVLYVGGFFLMGLTGRELAEAFRRARSHGVRTVLDVVTPIGETDLANEIAPALDETDVFLPNDREAEAITGLSDPVAQAERLHALGAKAVVVTQGSGGCVYVSAEERFRAGVFPTEFVDGTGGGDAFDAGFIRGLLEGAPARRCVELGAALGASCVRVSGATDGVFDRAAADEFLRTRRLAFESF